MTWPVSLTVELDENTTTGYHWVVATLTEGVEVTSDEHLGAQSRDTPPEQILVGAAGRRRLTFVAPGPFVALLEYRRPWEPADTPAARTHTVSFG